MNCAAVATRVSHHSVARLLGHELGYRLQGNAKTLEGAQHPDRDAQFRYINDQVTAALAAGEPVISADAKKKELIGPYASKGRTCGSPVAYRAGEHPRFHRQATGQGGALRGV